MTRDTARATRGRRFGVRLCCPTSWAYAALFRVVSFTLPFLGGRRSTPARLAPERPIAVACAGDRALRCLRRDLRIFLPTKAPGRVVAGLASRLTPRALVTVLWLGIRCMV